MIMLDIFKEKFSRGCDSIVSDSQFKNGVHCPRRKCDRNPDMILFSTYLIFWTTHNPFLFFLSSPPPLTTPPGMTPSKDAE
jgi:hypothetical protein